MRISKLCGEAHHHADGHLLFWLQQPSRDLDKLCWECDVIELMKHFQVEGSNSSVNLQLVKTIKRKFKLNEQIQKIKVVNKPLKPNCDIFFFTVYTVLPVHTANETIVNKILNGDKLESTHRAHVMLLLNVTVNLFEILMMYIKPFGPEVEKDQRMKSSNNEMNQRLHCW